MKKLAVSLAVLLTPAIALAEGINSTAIEGTITNLTNVVNALVPFFLAIAVVVFIYGVIKYVFQPSEEGRKEARNYIIWGIIAMAVILAIFGLAKLLLGSLGVTPGEGPGTLPKVNP